MSQLDLNNMVLNDIEVSLVTNAQKTGVFDVLMSAVNEDINKQFLEGRINNNEFASVYLGSIQAVLAQSIQFVLQEQVSEAQISSILKDNLLKDKQAELADIDKEVKQYELDNLLPEQLLKIQEEIDLLQTQDSEMLLDGAKKRLIMDEEIETADLQQAVLVVEEGVKEAQKSEIIDSTLRANTQLDDSLITSKEQRDTMYTDRVIKDKQAAKLGMDNVMKSEESARTDNPDHIYKPKYIQE